MRSSVALLIVSLAALTFAQPGYCGQWMVTLKVQGKTVADTGDNAYWSAFGTNKNRKWNMDDSGNSSESEVGAYFHDSALGTLYSQYQNEGPTGTSKVECGGSITPVFTWTPTGSLEDDPPSSVIQYKESASVHASRGGGPGIQRFPQYTNTVSMDLENQVLTEDYDGKTINGEVHTVLRNGKRAAVVHGKTRTLTSSGTGISPWNKYGGMEHVCGIGYEVSVTPLGGKAKFSVYKENPYDGNYYSLFSDESTESDKPVVGDRVWVGMEFQMGPHSHLDPALQSIKVRIKEEEDPKLEAEQHTDADNHVDVTLPLTPGNNQGLMKWQKRVGYPEGDIGWEDTTEPFSTSSGEDNVGYRVLWAWETHKVQKQGGTKLWDHNGEHKISLVAINGKQVTETSSPKIEFMPDEGEDHYSTAVGNFFPRKVDVRNLFITDVSTTTGNSDYFKFDPFNTELGLSAPIIKFRIDDEGDSNSYEWRVRVRSTDKENESESTVYYGTVEQPGLVTVSINEGAISSDSPNGRIAETSTYNFQISVREVKESILTDYADVRSRVFIPFKMPSPNNNLFGHDDTLVKSEGINDKWYVYYYLKDDDEIYASNKKENMRSVKVEILNPFFSRVKEISSIDGALPKSTNTPHMGEASLGIFVYDFPQEGSEEEVKNSETGNPYISVITAVDDYALLYRNHTSRSILAKNKRASSLVK